MADIWFDVDAGLAEVPVNILPLLDSTDFKTIEDAVAYNAAGMALRWHFVTTAGAYTVTSVTPTSGGDYDWTDQGDSGVYTIEIPASGGASINNDTEGFGWFTGVATGVLPWRGPICGFRAAALNNSLIDAGTTGLLGPTTAGRTLDVSAGGEAGVDWANVGSANTSVNLSATTVNLTNTVTTYTGNTPQTGDSFARIGATGSGLTSLAPSATALSTAQWTNARAGYLDNLNIGGAVASQSSVNTIDDFLDTEIAAILAAVDTEVSDIKAKTDQLTFTKANEVDANVQSINGTTVNGDGGGTPWGP